jgi:polar amino acid transport system substrate-binding protein
MNPVKTALHGLMAMALLVAGGVASAEPIVIYTENYPPFSFEDTDGAIAGSATRNVRQIMEEAGLAYEIRLVPWARGVLLAASQENAFIYSMTRTPERETRYDWLAPLADADFQVFKRAGDMRAVTRDGIQAGAFTGACVSGDLACDLFRRIGLPEDKLRVVTNNPTGDFRMVHAGRADLYITQTAVNTLWRQREGFDPGVTVPALDLGSEAGLYLVAGWQVPETLRNRVRAAFDALSARGSYKRAAAQPED